MKSIVAYITFSLLLLWSENTFSQSYGNEWIRYNQVYFKIPVAKNGIYRLSYDNLISAGFPANADFNRIQLFHRGVEQHIFIKKSNPNNLNLEVGDFIEFYGIQNTGTSDVELYRKSVDQPHQYYNLFSDTTSYFLTINTQGEIGLRMKDFTENFSTVPADQFHISEKLVILNSEYGEGKRYNESSVTYVQLSEFETGEGWTGKEIIQGQSLSYLIEGITAKATSSGNPTITIQLVGRTRGLHPFEISVGPSSPSRIISNSSFSDFNVITIETVLNWSDISSDGKISIKITALPTGLTGYRLSASFIKINFPQQIDMEGESQKIFTLSQRIDNKAFIQIQNPPPGEVKLYDVSSSGQPRTIGTTKSTTINAVIDNANTSRKIFATNSFLTPSIEKIKFRDIDASGHNYLIISHKSLMMPSGGFSNPVKEYASYRASNEGGNYDTLVIDIHQLYNQFNYGEVSPLAIRRFLKFMLDNGAPNYLFLIGKGLEVKYGYHRDPSHPSLNGFHDLIPPAGSPTSDMQFSVGLGNSKFEPAIPTGRISASTSLQVLEYLNKVKEMESIEFNDLWRKNLLHLSGGLTTIEQGQFKFYLEYLGEKAKDYYLGGKVTPIAKNSTDLQYFNITDEINEGVNLVTMFGHSGSSSGEINVGKATDPELGYSNKGKYPIFLANGCSAGDFFSKSIRWPEDWIFASEKGAIGFMANTGYGFDEVLSYYSNTLYTVAFNDFNYSDKGIGDVQKEVVKRMINGLNDESDTVRYLAQAHQMFLLGDPAVKIFGESKSDYEINENSVKESSFSVNQITTASDSFALKLVVRNFGKALKDSVNIRVTRSYGDNLTIVYDSLFPPVLFMDTLMFVIYRVDDGGGLNNFTIEIDPENEISEVSEQNNRVEFEILIPTNIPINLFPNDYAIVNTELARLIVQSFNVFDTPREFVIQLDTVPTFDSDFLKSEIVNGKIAVGEFQLVEGVDTLAYYWRSKFLVEKPNESNNWSLSSFTYIKNGNEGWAQVHFPQIIDNTLESLIVDSIARKVEFRESINRISVSSFGSFASGYQTLQSRTFHPDLSIKVGGTEYHALSLIQEDPNSRPCVINTLNGIAFNKTSTRPFVNPSFQSTGLTCGRRPEIVASFNQTNIETHLAQYVNNIALGDSVVFFTLGNPGLGQWSQNVLNLLGELGISEVQINSIIPGEPIVILTKKGSSVGSALIKRSNVTPETQQSIVVNSTITGKSISGIISSRLIGPALAWGKLYLKIEISELPQTDELSFDIIGIKLSGEETLLRSGITSSSEDLADIDASEYPYLRLEYHAKDAINLTPAQLNKWIVTYTPAPEGVIIYNGTFDQQILSEGEVWMANFSFQNISDKQFNEPLTVQYTVNNTAQRKTFTNEQEIAAPLPGEKTDFDIAVNTVEKVGLNNLKVFANPRVVPELYFDNNVAELKSIFKVEADEISPVLDVTFDGRYLKNGDYVSANPVVSFQLWDENKLILKTDPADIIIFLNTDQIVFDENITWTPATTETPFTANFTMRDLQPGDYTFQISAKDARSNTVSYEVMFVVAEDNTIRISKPYPNPSASSFFFDITVTGDNQPDVAYLQIVNLMGGIVAEFSMTEFYTGTNTFVWNSTDTLGNQLKNGLYLYRVLVNKNGNPLKSASGKILLNR